MKKLKIALIGTSCAGKTTLVHEILSKLKRYSVLAEGVLSQDRKFTFDRTVLETDINAQYWMVLNIAAKESELLAHTDCDVVVSDRSVLDMYAYLVYQYGEDNAVSRFVQDWVLTYDRLYLLQPLAYQNDGTRPSDAFRIGVGKLLDKMVESLPNVVVGMSNEDIIKDIVSVTGKILTDEDLRIIPHVLGMTEVLIGGSYAYDRATRFSDLDVYILGDPDTTVAVSIDMEQKLKRILGVDVDVTVVGSEVYEYLIVQSKFKKVVLSTNKRSS